MEPIPPPKNLSVYILASIGSSGALTTHNPSNISITGSIFPGYYTSLEEAQQEQMLLALKGTTAHVFALDFPRP